MALKQIVTLKGQKDGIDIILDAKSDIEAIKESLRTKVAKGKKFFDGADTKVSFKGRELDEFEEKTLIDIIISETNLDITFVQGADYAAPDPVIKPDLPVPHPSSVPRSEKKESLTAYYHGGLRSGQSIKYKGSVVIMGDVNPGSEVIADGNVVILGALKGMAHAGADGDDTCFVSALLLRPTQLRIAGLISFVPETAKNVRSSAAYAYIKDGQVFIGPL